MLFYIFTYKRVFMCACVKEKGEKKVRNNLNLFFFFSMQIMWAQIGT